MVFRGKPSKACQRCRQRRLRCDLKQPCCSPCIRAQEGCTYRTTETVRIVDETSIVQAKANTRTSPPRSKQSPATIKFQNRYLPQDLEIVGRDLFLAYYVSDFSRCWEFLFDYLNTDHTPKFLNLTIDAVGLAFLSHHVKSQTARELGRRKYVEALQKTSMALQDPDTARQTSTVQVALLMDLFEKLMKVHHDNEQPRDAHVEGALALVKLRGIESFTDSAEIKCLLGLSLTTTINCWSTGRPIPRDMLKIREYASNFTDTTYPKWRLSGLMVEATDLATAGRSGILTVSERLERSIDLDKKLECLARDAQTVWKFDRRYMHKDTPGSVSPQHPTSFCDVYNDRLETQMFNHLRTTRIMLCEEIIECSSIQESSEDISSTDSHRAKRAIVEMAYDICASAPQMTDCDCVAQHKIVDCGSPGSPGRPITHTHSMSHMLDVYTLLFGLYVVAWARHSPTALRAWTINQLKIAAEHFGIQEAGMIITHLQKQETEQYVDLWTSGPWYVYRLLGSHAFAAT